MVTRTGLCRRKGLSRTRSGPNTRKRARPITPRAERPGAWNPLRRVPDV